MNWLQRISQTITVSPDVHMTYDYNDPTPVDPGFIEQAEKALRQYLDAMGGEMTRFVKPRYEFHLRMINDRYNETRYTFDIVPKNKGKVVYDRRGDPQYTFGAPQEAIKEIDPNPEYAYRGMSKEEWDFIREKGYIQSKGWYNFQGQEGQTLWAPNPSTALSYGSGFTPLQYMPTHNRPSMVVAIPRSLTKPAGVANPGELFTDEPIPKDYIQEAYMMIPVSIGHGEIEVIVEKGVQHKWQIRSIRQGSGLTPSVRYVLLRIQ